MTEANEKGRLSIPRGCHPDEKELRAVSLFIARGYDVEFIVPSRIKGQKSPDIQMLGVVWEIKTPLGDSKNTIFNAMKRAVKQSEFVIVDLRYTKIPEKRAIEDIYASFTATRSVRKVIVITKSGGVIDIP